MTQPEQDIWQNVSQSSSDPDSTQLTDLRFELERLPVAATLEAQQGRASTKTVPESITDTLFPPTGTAADEGVFHTYAILDAAKMPYVLTGLIEASGLRHRSLFQGQTQEDLEEYAPYLVELEDGNDFTRKIFTTEKFMGFWEKELGIYIRAKADFDTMRKHFRKFTRVQDEAGSWFYWRFWEGQKLPTVLRAFDPKERNQFFMDGKIFCIVILTVDYGAFRMSLTRTKPAAVHEEQI